MTEGGGHEARKSLVGCRCPIGRQLFLDPKRINPPAGSRPKIQLGLPRPAAGREKVGCLGRCGRRMAPEGGPAKKKESRMWSSTSLGQPRAKPKPIGKGRIGGSADGGIGWPRIFMDRRVVNREE